MAPVYADHPFNLIHTPIYGLPKDAKPDFFDSLASEMALVHNLVIRGLNAIVLQAPTSSPRMRLRSATSYRTGVSSSALTTAARKALLPRNRKVDGEKGIMDTNIGQHDMFHAELDGFEEYVKGCIAGKTKFDRNEVVSRLDGFAQTLVTHLNEEIPSLLDLRKFGVEKMAPLTKIIEEEVKEGMGSMTFTGGMSWFLSVIMFLCRHLTFGVHADWWKFGPCDKWGRMQPLYAVPEEETK
ncbi:unnamed protein product [Parascedosporium putredinis]|uniref:Hemerythrin-like domain-containing protein n=1 Tax=Parascedosporium putredinis TaxID=1442378 RepID=A0A9P1H0H2_9PEZI|nr:unnamed protein product [Parascedosporium putredinis]CAI7993936.1 unnamed protein product [Parascedosporium putredinis]